jgi:hypothetical protein
MHRVESTLTVKSTYQHDVMIRTCIIARELGNKDKMTNTRLYTQSQKLKRLEKGHVESHHNRNDDISNVMPGQLRRNFQNSKLNFKVQDKFQKNSLQHLLKGKSHIDRYDRCYPRENWPRQNPT